MVKKIALLTDGIWPFTIGGMQKHSYYLCKNLASAGVKVDVYYTIQGESINTDLRQIFSENEWHNITAFEVKHQDKGKYPGHYIKASYDRSKALYEKLIKNIENYDLIYIQGFSGWYFLDKTEKEKRPPCILNFHGLEMFQQPASFKSGLEQLMFRPFVKGNLRKADYVQSLGGKLTNIFINQGINEARVLKIGIAIEENWLTQKKELTTNTVRKFVFIGRYERRKGIEELCEVLKTLENEFEFDFHFIGPIPVKKQLRSSKITYHGQVSEENRIKALLDDADFLVTPSHSEGMPTVILEAMARKCAIIATNVGAVADQVDEKNGFLIPANDIGALRLAVIRAIELGNDELNALKLASFQKNQQKFTWNTLTGEMLQVFTSIADKKEHLLRAVVNAKNQAKGK